VRSGVGEAVFDVAEDGCLRQSQNTKMGELSKARKLAGENRDLILEKWGELLG
jgi:hypothetical protein